MTQSTDDLVREMPLDEALDKARRYANDEKFKDMPSVSRTLLVAVERLQADLAARDKTIETLVGVADRVLVKYGNDWTEWRDLQDAIEAARSEGGKP